MVLQCPIIVHYFGPIHYICVGEKKGSKSYEKIVSQLHVFVKIKMRSKIRIDK